MSVASEYRVKGLTSQQVSEARVAHGRSEFINEDHSFLTKLNELLKDSILLLSLVSSLLLISENIILTLVNRSFSYSFITTLLYRNSLVLIVVATTILLTALLLLIPPFTNFFGFEPINNSQLLRSVAIGCTSVICFELVKEFKQKERWWNVVVTKEPSNSGLIQNVIPN